MKILNQFIQFIVEMAMLVALGYSGFQLGKTSLEKYAFAILFLAVTIVLWWLFASPKAPYRLELPIRLFFKLALFIVTAFLLYKSGQTNIAIIFACVALANELVAALVFKQ